MLGSALLGATTVGAPDATPVVQLSTNVADGTSVTAALGYRFQLAGHANGTSSAVGTMTSPHNIQGQIRDVSVVTGGIGLSLRAGVITGSTVVAAIVVRGFSGDVYGVAVLIGWLSVRSPVPISIAIHAERAVKLALG